MNKQITSSNIIRGCWQLASGHSQGVGSREPILDAVRSGFTTFDCADIYLGVEELLGQAAGALPENKLRIHTKFVPDLNRLQDIDQKYVESIIDRSRQRLQVDKLDLVQFHWWDWKIEKYLPALEYLSELKAQGKIAEIGLTNVNRTYLQEITTHFDIASLQVQVSLFDRRVEQGVAQLCRERGMKILGYGSLLGGFVSEKWVNQQEPELQELPNRSLVKYKLLIDAACGWEEFQRRLLILRKLAAKYECEMGNIAIAALLQGGKADSVIVGLSPYNFATQNCGLAELPELQGEEVDEITAWPCNLGGDVYEEERDEQGAHAKIMKYNLNAQ